MSKSLKKKLIGHVGVDSGQILVCDPCYIDSLWRHDDEYERDQRYRIFWNGRIIYWDMGESLKAGILFNTPLGDFNNKTMNDLIKEGIAVEEPVRKTKVFGYNGCCRETQSEDRAGELDDGTGVACATAFGDGSYPVYVYYDESGNPVKLEVKLT